MKIEVGKSYRTAGGYKATVMSTDGSETPFRVRHYTPAGTLRLWHYANGECNTSNRHRDLIAEWTDPAPEPAKVGLPDAMRFADNVGDTMDVHQALEFVALTATADGDVEANFVFTPERARALAAALIAYADQAEAAA